MAQRTGKKLMVFNIKGGQGKTSIALNLALTLGWGFITNEPLSPVNLILPEKRFLRLEPKETLPEIPSDFNVIFDFGGYLDKRVITALKQTDIVFIPVLKEFIDLFTTVNFIQEIESYNKNIIIIANKTVKGDFEKIQEIINKNYPDYPCFEIKKSRAMPNILTEKLSVRDQIKKYPMREYHFKEIKDQFDRLIEYIKKEK